MFKLLSVGSETFSEACWALIMLLFFAFLLALFNLELKEEFTTSTIARKQSKPIIPKLLCKRRKENILEIFSTVLCDI